MLVYTLYCLCEYVSPYYCINGDLAIAGVANVKLYMSDIMVEVLVGLWVPTSSSMRPVQSSCKALIPSPGGFVLHRLTVPV